MKGKLTFTALLLLAVFMGGCLQETQQVDQSLESLTESPALTGLSQETAVQLCVNACQEAKDAGTNLNDGPCLLDPITEMPAWVCDVAHSPRADVDNIRANQCDAWHDGTASHFIEVDPDCEFIKAV